MAENPAAVAGSLLGRELWAGDPDRVAATFFAPLISDVFPEKEDCEDNARKSGMLRFDAASD